MTGWQKFTVLMVGLICIAVICYYFEQAGESSDTKQAGLTVQQTGAAAAEPAPGQPVAREGGNRDRIAMADLVAQFTDLYEQPAQAEPEERGDVIAEASTPRDDRPERPSWSVPAAPAAAMVSPTNNAPGMPEFDTMFAGATPGNPPAGGVDNRDPSLPGFGGPAVHEDENAYTDPTMVAFVPDEPEMAADPVVEDVQPIEATPTQRAPVAAAVTKIGPVQPQVLTVGAEPEPAEPVAAANTNRGSTNASTLGINDFGAGSRQTVTTAADPEPYEPPVTTREPVAASNRQPDSWQQTLVKPDLLPVRTSRETASVGRRTYTVQSGDSFSSIAITVFGSEARYLDIVKANPRIDPRRLKVGQVINLPADSPAVGASVAAPEPVRRSSRFHVVGVGDNLSNIAHRYYKDASKWQQIHKANRDLIGPNPNKLKAGMKLTIPTL